LTKKRLLGRITALHKRGIISGLKKLLTEKFKIRKRGQPKKVEIKDPSPFPIISERD